MYVYIYIYIIFFFSDPLWTPITVWLDFAAECPPACADPDNPPETQTHAGPSE